MSDTLDYLKKAPLFNNIDDPTLNQIITIGEIEKIEEDQFLVKEGEASGRFFLILDGSVSIEITSSMDNKTQEIAERKPGDTIGEMVLANKSRRSATVKVKRGGMVMSWNKDSLLGFAKENPEFGFVFMSNLCEIICTRLVDSTLTLRRFI